jgi:iron complex transport system substrate-binding protein
MRKVVDHAGREREIPVEINKVFTTGLMGSIFLYTLAPEKMIGWNNDIYEETLPYIRAEYASLPVLGRWTGTDMTGSIEELMKLSPDILINVGTISDEWIEISDEIENQLGIPVLMVSGEFYDISKAYEFMGDLLDQEKRAKTLADYARNTEKEIAELQNSLEGIEKKRTYLASGPDGLETASKGTINVELLELMGGEIVVETGGGRMEVSIEQVLLYDPEVIFVSGDSKTITDSVIWNSVSAVKNSQVYSIPKVPFDWMNRPPSIMRLIGAKWVGKALYPELFPVDLEVETAEFLELFFE